MEISSTNKSLSIRDIREFESRHDLKLPTDYIAFLLENNGGCPEPACFEKNGVGVYINYFYPIAEGAESSLDDEIAKYPGCVDAGVIPVALDGGGGEVFISLENGNILVWDPELFDIFDSNWKFQIESLQYLAASIKQLVHGLNDLDDE